MIQSCRLEAMLAAESCHLAGRCYRNRSSRRPPCCGNYMVTVGPRRPQLDLNKMMCVCWCVWLFLSFFYSFSSFPQQAGRQIKSSLALRTRLIGLIPSIFRSSKVKNKHHSSDMHMLELQASRELGSPGRRSRPAPFSGMHRECWDICIRAQTGKTRTRTRTRAHGRWQKPRPAMGDSEVREAEELKKLLRQPIKSGKERTAPLTRSA